MCCSGGLFFPLSHPPIEYTAPEENIGLVPIFPYFIGRIETIKGSYHSASVDAVPLTEPQVGRIRDWIQPRLNTSQPFCITSSQLVDVSAPTPNTNPTPEYVQPCLGKGSLQSSSSYGSYAADPNVDNVSGDLT